MNVCPKCKCEYEEQYDVCPACGYYKSDNRKCDIQDSMNTLKEPKPEITFWVLMASSIGMILCTLLMKIRCSVGVFGVGLYGDYSLLNLYRQIKKISRYLDHSIINLVTTVIIILFIAGLGIVSWHCEKEPIKGSVMWQNSIYSGSNYLSVYYYCNELCFQCGSKKTLWSNND